MPKELAAQAKTGLNLVIDQRDVVGARQVGECLMEPSRGIAIAAFALHRFNQDGEHALGSQVLAHSRKRLDFTLEDGVGRIQSLK